MSKFAEIKQKLTEKIAPLREKLFGKKAEGEEGADAAAKPKSSNGPVAKIRAAYKEGSTGDRVIVLLVVATFIFGVFSFYKAANNLLGRKTLMESMFAHDKENTFNKMEEVLKREADTKKEIGSTVSLNKIKINYNRVNGTRGFISISIWVKCDSPQTAELVEEEYPKFHSAIIERIQSVDESKITTEAGKKAIQNEMLIAMNSALHHGKIEKIFFHNMVAE